MRVALMDRERIDQGGFVALGQERDLTASLQAPHARLAAPSAPDAPGPPRLRPPASKARNGSCSLRFEIMIS